MKLEPISGALGAEVSGIDLKTMNDEQHRAIESAFTRHLVLCFRDQSLTPGDLLALTKRLGGIGDTPYLGGLTDHPDVVPVIKEPGEKSPHTFGAGWHTDFTFLEAPPDRTLLYAVDTPEVGGDTLFANLYTAFDTLSSGLKEQLMMLQAEHSAVRSYGPKATLRDHMENMEITNDKEEPVTQLHPVIRRHPASGLPVLWVNPTYTIRFQNMTEAESTPLLNYLNNIAVSPSNTCRVTWRPGTLTMWDNRCTQHCATSDYAGHRREMWRTTTQGLKPEVYA